MDFDWKQTKTNTIFFLRFEHISSSLYTLIIWKITICKYIDYWLIKRKKIQKIKYQKLIDSQLIQFSFHSITNFFFSLSLIDILLLLLLLLSWLSLCHKHFQQENGESRKKNFLNKFAIIIMTICGKEKKKPIFFY